MISFTYQAVGENAVKITSTENKVMHFGMNFFDFESSLRSYQQGAFMQDAFPALSPDEREFLISGLLPHEFDELYKEED